MQATVTRENMTLDLVVWQAFGRQDGGLVAQTLALNPGLAALGVILPVGTVVKLPEPAAPTPPLRDTVRLW